MKVINYVWNNHRSSITVTEAQKLAIKYIREREGIASDEKFVQLVLTLTPKIGNISMAVRDYIILRLLSYVEVANIKLTTKDIDNMEIQANLMASGFMSGSQIRKEFNNWKRRKK